MKEVMSVSYKTGKMRGEISVHLFMLVKQHPCHFPTFFAVTLASTQSKMVDLAVVHIQRIKLKIHSLEQS